MAVAALRGGQALESEPAPPVDPELAEEGDDAAEEVAAAEPALAPAGGSAQGRRLRRRAGGPLAVAAYAGGARCSSPRRRPSPRSRSRAASARRGARLEDDRDGRGAVGRPPLEHDTLVAAYLIDPARRGYPLDELATEAGIGARRRGGRTAGGRPPSARCSRACSPSASARGSRRTGLTRLLDEVELPLVDVLLEMERAGVKLDTRAARARSPRAFGERGRRARARDLGARGRGVHDRLAAAARARSCSRSSGCRASAAARPGFSTDARVLQAIRDEHEIIPKIEDWRELTKLKSTYLDAFPELIGARRAPAHHLQPDRRGHGPPVEHEPEPAEHPDPHRAGARDPRLLRGRGRATGCVSADYSQVELRLLAHIADEQVLKEIFRRGEDVHTATAEAILGGTDRPGHALEGEDGQLRDRLRAVRLRPRRPAADPAGGGAGVHRRLPRALPEGAGVHRGDDRERERGGLRDHALRPHPPRSPSCARASCQTRSLGERLAVNMVIQGTAADIIKVAMVRCRDALRAAGLDTRLVLQIHDELLFEGPEAEVEQASEIVRREMAARSRWTRRSRSTWAPARTGWRPSSLDAKWPRRPRTVCRRRADRPAGPDQLDARQVGRHPRGRVRLVRDRAWRPRGHHPAGGRGLRRSRRGARPAVVLPDRRPARRGLRDHGADRRPRSSAPGGVTAATIAGQLTLSRRARPRRGPRPRGARAELSPRVLGCRARGARDVPGRARLDDAGAVAGGDPGARARVQPRARAPRLQRPRTPAARSRR